MRTALLVIDMQEASFTPRSVRHDTAGVVDRINSLAARVRANGGAVIFVQHAGPEGDAHHPNASGHKLLTELRVEDGDRLVEKRSCDAFLNTSMEAILKEMRIGQLIVTGCATDFCVDTTVRSALAKGYATIVPSDGHTTANRPHLSAAKIIDHHNAIWSDFLSPAGAARVVPSAQILPV